MSAQPAPTPSLSRSQVRAIDRLAFEEFSIPGVLLMENAGRGASLAALDLLSLMGRRSGCVHVLCGGGNNGGDGYVLARHLHNAGQELHLWTYGPIERLPADAALNRKIVERMGLHLTSVDSPAGLKSAAQAWSSGALLVDAYLGTGFQGKLRASGAAVIRAYCAAREKGGVPSLALDIPSGLDCDTGRALGDCIRADVTATFVAPKKGFDEAGSREFTGRIVVVDIGVPAALIAAVRALGQELEGL